MPIPAIVAILGKVLGGLSAAKGLSKTEEDENKLTFNGRQSNQNTPTIGDAMGGQQPQQQMPQQTGGGFEKFQNGANKAMTIVSLLNSLKGNDQQQQPYQMMLNRRR